MRDLKCTILMVRASLFLFFMIWGVHALADDDQAVIVYFTYGSTDLSNLFKLEDELEKAIRVAAVGEYDGNEIAVDGSDGHLYMYGPNADKLFEIVLPILETTEFMDGAIVRVRYGPPADGVQEREIRIGG